ncbi:MAG TPA: HEPN domain-containing protein [Candidatus Paceibacterota bacterium]
MTEAFQKQIEWWRESSEKDFEVAKVLFGQKYYSHSLVLCHLCLEKILKATVMKHTGKEAPFIHDLRRLAEIAEIPMSEEQQELFDIISNFHIVGRYPDQKFEFYKEYNSRDKAQEYINHTQHLYSWLQKEFQKK